MSEIAIALGIFDGVHLGHQAVIKKMLSYKKYGYNTSVFTFNLDNFSQKNTSAFIYSQAERSEIFKSLGVDFEFIYDIEKIKDYSPFEFVKKIILEEIGAKVLVCGENFRFGKNAVGDVNTLKSACEQLNLRCEVVSFVQNDQNTVISSSVIRDEIKNGEISTANSLLGSPYFIGGTVCNGNKIGRTLDFPTANISLPKSRVVPKFGVYASFVQINQKKYRSITNIGVKPTVTNEKIVTVETHILDFDDDIYDKKIVVYLTDFMRSEQKFDSLDYLKEQIQKDILHRKELI